MSDLNSENSVLLIIDMQEKFETVIEGFDDIVMNIGKLIRSFNLLGIPIIVTEQYPKGLGKTIQPITQQLRKHDLVEKTTFNCFDNSDFSQLIQKLNKPNLIICGIEAHVCIFQTVEAALSKGFNVHPVFDAISSRKRSDYLIAMKRISSEGVKSSTAEMVLFQMLKDSNHPKFKEISKIICE